MRLTDVIIDSDDPAAARGRLEALFELDDEGRADYLQSVGWFHGALCG